MKLTATLFALSAFSTFVTSIPLLDSVSRVNDGYVNATVTTKKLDEQNIDKRELSPEMYDIMNAAYVYADEYNVYRGYSRSGFTQNIVQALYKRNSHFNYIICHPAHAYDFGSPWGADVYNVWVTYEDGNLFNNGHGYDIVIGKNGTFTSYKANKLQWAYIGDVINTQDLDTENAVGVIVTFGIPA